MKTILLVPAFIASILVSQSTHAADWFRCSVSKTVMQNSLCTVCIERVAENCMKEEELPCLVEAKVETGVSHVVLHPSGEFFLGDKNDDVSFIFSLSKSGYSARVSSISAKAEVTVSTNVPLNPWHDAVTVSAKTSLSRDVAGSVTNIILYCQAE
jgi:hypothetical protein